MRLPRLKGVLPLAKLARRRAGRAGLNRTPESPTDSPTASTPATDPGTLGNDRADPGEIVWAWVPYEEDASRGKDRPVLVLDVHGNEVTALMLTSKDHDRDAEQEAAAGRVWMDIGSGGWDSQRRPSEVRLDRLIHLPGNKIRREGAVLDPAIFAQVVTARRDVS